MLAVAPVNWTYLLILLVPSLFVLMIMGLTWRNRMKRQGGAGSSSQRSGGGKPGAKPGTKPGGKPSGSSGRTSGGSGGKPGGRSPGSSNAKRPTK